MDVMRHATACSSRLSWTRDEDFKNRGTREGANERRHVDTGYTYETYLRKVCNG
jgi:hypothetical protein